MPLLLARTVTATGPVPVIYFMHGGGMVMGTNRRSVDYLLDWAEELSPAIVSVGYRLAPENPCPAPLDDAYAGLNWMADHGKENRARRDAHRGHRIQRWWRHRGRPLLGRTTPRRRAAVRPAAGRTDARLAGGIAELHVWPGGFHGFDLLAPEAALSQDARATRLHWLHCPLA